MPSYENDPIIVRTNTLDGAVVGINENHTPQAGPGVKVMVLVFGAQVKLGWEFTVTLKAQLAVLVLWVRA
jgi:hydrogenase/urease accessory protein HupE